jgi:hypothetical protein
MMKAIPGRSIRDRNGDMKIVVASASGSNGNGYGKLLAFSGDGAPFGAFNDDVAAFPQSARRVVGKMEILRGPACPRAKVPQI